MSVTGTGVMR